MNPRPVPIYRVSLDDAPSNRWLHVVRDFLPQLRDAQRFIDSYSRSLPWWVRTLWRSANSLLWLLAKNGGVYASEELQSIATASSIPLGKLVSMQLMYEACTCCTSIIVNDERRGYPIHIRTMDWAMDFLKDLTVEIDFCSRGRCIYRATTWVGYVGVLTGMKSNCFSIAVNFRSTDGGSFFGNIKNLIGYRWPIGYLVRQVLENTTSFDSALNILAQSHLVAPCYITLAGVRMHDGVILTRDDKTDHARSYLSVFKPFLIQTNIDPWSDSLEEDVFNSILRRRMAQQLLENSLREMKKRDNYEDIEARLWKILATQPITNEITIYGSLMIPAEGKMISKFPDLFSS